MKIKRFFSLTLCFLIMFLMVIPALSVSAASKPVITVESCNLTPYIDSEGYIKLKVIGGENVSYQWQAGFFSDGTCVDLDDNHAYHGTKTNHFRLTAMNKLDQLDFRCKVTYDGGSVYSQTFRFTFIEPTLLENAYVSDLSEPWFANVPDFDLTVSETADYTVNKVEWYGPQNGTAYPIMNSSDVYIPGDYYCRIYLKPSEEYKFDESTKLRVYVDGKTESYSMTMNMQKNDSGEYYGEFPFTVKQESGNESGVLAFEWKNPSEMAPNVNLGKAYLGKDSMDIPFAFRIKDLPRSMALAGYSTYGSTYISLDSKSLYYAHSGDRVNLKDVATKPGTYHIFHEIFLLDPDGNEIATEDVHYFVNVYEPKIINEVSVEVDEPGAGEYAEIAILDKISGASANEMYWYDVTDGKHILLDESDIFEKGHTYQVEVWMRADEGYFLNTDADGCLDVVAKINGKDADVMLAYSDKAVGFTMDFVVPDDDFMLGDVNGDGEISVEDVTQIQLHIAKLVELDDKQLKCADTDRDGIVSVPDVTQLQLFIAKLIPQL